MQCNHAERKCFFHRSPKAMSIDKTMKNNSERSNQFSLFSNTLNILQDRKFLMTSRMTMTVYEVGQLKHRTVT